MLVASRDPFHSGAPHVASAEGGGKANRFARAMNALQIAGTLLAIPVGLGSAYTMYRANFTVEATCQSLRGNIVAMLDKIVDPATRHMLVRHDVEAFEKACRTVDPDATAAFKALLAADNPASPVAAAKPAETRAEPVARKAEPPRPAVAVKQTPAIAAPVKTEAAAPPRETSSDAAWIGAVRQAIVSRPVESKSGVEPVKAAAVAPTSPVEPVKAAVTPTPAAPVATLEVRHSDETRAQPLTLAAPVQITAPVLPPPTAVAVAPALPLDDGHPVPPASIPEPPPLPQVIAAKPAEHSQTRLGGLVAKIPLLGWAFDR